MNTNETDNFESTNEAETTENTEAEEVQSEETADDSQEINELRKRNLELEGDNKTLKVQKDKWRVKANSKGTAQKETSGELSTDDLYTLMSSNVPQDDVNDVREYAKLKGVTIKEALQSTMVKGLLAESAEQRITASAANVGGAKGGSGKISDDVLLRKSSAGELPESHDDLMRLVKLKQGINKK